MIVLNFCNVLVAADANADLATYYFPGTPPRPTQIGNLQFRHEPGAVGTLQWEQDITDKLRHLQDQLPPNHDAHAAALKESYDDHLEVIEQDCARIEDFLEKMESKKLVLEKEQQTARSYLDAMIKHYGDLSELAFNIFLQNPQWVQALHNLVLNKDEVERVTEKALNVKNNLEELMEKANLLPDDYDNGLI